MAEFAGKTAIVTGAAQGIGRAIAVALAEQGCNLVLVDRHAELCDAIVAQLAEMGADSLAVGVDLAEAEGAVRMVAETLNRFGRIDVAVHNVGGAIRAKPFWQFSHDQIRAEIDRSLWPTIWSCREVIPAMIGQGSGAIVNIGSAATSWMWRVPYSTAKGGISALTECLGRELAETGVRINCVAPGAIEVTDRISPRRPDPADEDEQRWLRAAYDQSIADTPMRRPGSVGEIARAAVFLASSQASYITGQTLHVAGGASG